MVSFIIYSSMICTVVILISGIQLNAEDPGRILCGLCLVVPCRAHPYTCCMICIVHTNYNHTKSKINVYYCYINVFAVFVDHNDSINTVDDTEVQFSCIAINASLVLFEVNCTSASELSVIYESFRQLGLKILSTTKRINLTAIALTQYNNTEIQSRTIVFSSAFQILSDYATLLVQGKAIYQ